MDIPTIEAAHLVLRSWMAQDAEAWFNILQEEDILRYFPNPKPPAREKADTYIQHHLQHWQEFGYGHWAVTTRQDGQVVGWCGLEFLPELKQTEIAYLLSKSVWGRGYATEAARAAVEYGMQKAGLSEIIGLVHPENSGSVRVLEKCGLSFNDRISLWGMEMLRYRIQRPPKR
jgi:RimJ/RimL family protein N-acetyltransferase